MVDHGKLQHFQPGEGVPAGTHSTSFDDAAWLDVAIPGDVHRTLIDAGRIPDPFYGLNETECRWMEDQEWWYRFQLEPVDAPAPDERLRLVFEGLDTYATIWLNGEELGQHQNMFRPATFDITDQLRPGQPNLVALRFDPPLLRTEDKSRSQWGPNPERTPMRKGPVRLRLGLGTAPADHRHLAARQTETAAPGSHHRGSFRDPGHRHRSRAGGGASSSRC